MGLVKVFVARIPIVLPKGGARVCVGVVGHCVAGEVISRSLNDARGTWLKRGLMVSPRWRLEGAENNIKFGG